MIHLSGTAKSISNWPCDTERKVFRLSNNLDRPDALKRNELFISQDNNMPTGFAGCVVFEELSEPLEPQEDAFVLQLPEQFRYLSDQDVLSVSRDTAKFRVLFRQESPHNSFLVTERCNHYCLMCSQPPRNVKDDWLVDEIIEVIKLINPATQEIGLTGGEPTLLEDRFLDIVAAAKAYLPHTSLHVLTNGRRFADRSFAQKYAQIRHPDLMAGIPIYSDISHIHDYVVQAEGAFDETIRGVLNLRALAQKIEIRVVIHKQTFSRLPNLAEFLARNLRFVDHVALMGLEMMGFTKANMDDLWIDPFDYQSQLNEAVSILADHGINVSVYNHQYCITPPAVWPFMTRSISDWKNEFMPECENCMVRNFCGGFFASAQFRYSDHIRPFDSNPIGL